MTTYDLNRGFTLTRQFDAPPDMVFDAWTRPEHLGWFFNPGHAAEPASVDLRVGGAWRQLMIENAEKSYVTGGVYREIARFDKLVFSWGAVGGWPALDLEQLDASLLVTLTFKSVGAERTEMELRVQLADHLTEARTEEWMTCGMVEGWGMTVDRLVDQLATAR